MNAVIIFGLCSLLGVASGQFNKKEVCCEHIGCFKKDGIFEKFHLPECPEKFGIEYYLYTRENRDQREEFGIGIIPKMFDPTRKTVVMSHGWRGHSELWWMLVIKDKLLNVGDVNVITVDWKEGSYNLWYPQAAANTRTVAAHVVHVLQPLLLEAGAHLSDFHCVGFSLGAHVCGRVGTLFNGQFARMTALDPAGPEFAGKDPAVGMNRESAKFVDIIHTDGRGVAAFAGLFEPRGHMDFYPNGGQYQPGCLTRKRREVADNFDDFEPIPIDDDMKDELIGCSHYRAVHYFMDSIENEGCHIARLRCSDADTIPKSCDLIEDEVKMGFYADTNKDLTGVYYLETKRNRPFCKY